jgi:uncharacterized membrane protein YfcA
MLSRSYLLKNAARWSHPNRTLKRLHANSSSSNTSKPDHADYVAAKSLAVGSLAGLCGSLVGLGGGFVMIPMMTSRFLRLSQHQAHGTSLFAVSTTGIAGALGYSGHVDFEAAAYIACTGMIAARFGATVMSRLPEATLQKALGVLMIAVAPLVPAKTYFMEASKEKEASRASKKTESKTSDFPQRLLVPAFIGSFSGFTAGLFGVGGGAIIVPALTVFTDLNHYQALGTSLCAMVLPAMSGTITHYGKGNVAMRVAPALATGAFVGAFLGGKLGLTIDESKLRWGFSSLMIVLGVRTLLT